MLHFSVTRRAKHSRSVHANFGPRAYTSLQNRCLSYKRATHFQQFKTKFVACGAVDGFLDQSGAHQKTPGHNEITRWEHHSITGFGTHELVTRPTTPQDSYPVADVHTAAFYPRSTYVAPLLRLDRVLALKVGRDAVRLQKSRCYECFVADIRPHWRPAPVLPPEGKAAALPSTLPGPLRASLRILLRMQCAAGKAADRARSCALHALLSSMQWEEAIVTWGVGHQQRGIVGAVVFDTLGYHVPAEWLPNGTLRRRTNVGYISNLAVAPCARRQGIASKLVKRCEDLAFEDPTVEVIALHVEATNVPGRHLYESCGYDAVTKDSESKWRCLLGIHDSSGGLQLMVKILREAETLASSDSISDSSMPPTAEVLSDI